MILPVQLSLHNVLDQCMSFVNRLQWAVLDRSLLFRVLDPVLNVPSVVKTRTFLPDPTDGSLYMYSSTHSGLKKMPFTIPQLVTASPCKSNADGILYTGQFANSFDEMGISYMNIQIGSSGILSCNTGTGELIFGLVCEVSTRSKIHVLSRTTKSLNLYLVVLVSNHQIIWMMYNITIILPVMHYWYQFHSTASLLHRRP